MLLAVVITGGSILGYAAFSLTANGVPPLRVFPGWMAVLEPVSELGEKVLLKVESDPVSDHPYVGYTVVACGPRPYTADLLIGGSARLTGIRPVPAQFAGALPEPQVEQLRDLVLGYGQPFDFGAVQLVRITLPAFPCAPAPAVPGAGGFDGAALEIAGYAGAPFQQSWNGPWGWWQGPHAVQAWPLAGALPGTSGAHGAFTGLSGISGQWVRPDASIEISTPDIPLDQSIDSAIPEPSDPAVASWSGSDGMNPVARLTDEPSLAVLQDWIVVFAIGLGIGGSMLASLLFEWLRPHPARTSQASTQPVYQARRVPARHFRPTARTSGRSSNRAALLAAVLLIAWARLRRSRHQP